MASINVYWLATQVAKDDIKASTMPLLMVEDILELAALNFDVFVHSVEALFDVSHSKRHDMGNQPLHSLPLPSFHQVRDTHDLFMWLDVNDYCLDTLNDISSRLNVRKGKFPCIKLMMPIDQGA
jgi:hypothetical protein